jgi:hypothetical protein
MKESKIKAKSSLRSKYWHFILQAGQQNKDLGGGREKHGFTPWMIGKQNMSRKYGMYSDIT